MQIDRIYASTTIYYPMIINCITYLPGVNLYVLAVMLLSEWNDICYKILFQVEFLYYVRI